MLAYYGWKPELADFKDMIMNRRVSLGFPLRGQTAGERIISAYPTKARAEYRTDGLYAPGWYLAHIVGVMDPFVNHEDIDLRHCLFPRGEIGDWRNEGLLPVRRMAREFNDREKEVIVAQFLRFLDPINYVLVPNEARERHLPQKRTRIGEEPSVIAYLKCWMRRYVGSEVYDEFCKLALVSADGGEDDLDSLGNEPLKVWTSPLAMDQEKTARRVKKQGSGKSLRKAVGEPRMGGDVPKAVRKMKRWSERPQEHPYRLIRAFLLLERDGVASYEQLKAYCSDRIDHPELYVECFAECGTWGSMKSDSGRNYGHVFECTRGSDEVRIWEPVRTELYQFRGAFLA